MDTVLILIFWALFYWTPFIVALYRKLDNRTQIGVLNFFAFAGIPWVIALVWAFKPKGVSNDV